MMDTLAFDFSYLWAMKHSFGDKKEDVEIGNYCYKDNEPNKSEARDNG